MSQIHHDTFHGHDYDLGFAHDLPKMIGRRRLLALMGEVGLVSLSGLPAIALECVALPWETAGPYPADGSNVRDGQLANALSQEGVIREDLRPSFGSLTPVADDGQCRRVARRMSFTTCSADCFVFVIFGVILGLSSLRRDQNSP